MPIREWTIRYDPYRIGIAPCGTPHPYPDETTSTDATRVTCPKCLGILTDEVERALLAEERWYWSNCPDCEGTGNAGLAAGDPMRACPVCSGSGTVKRRTTYR